MPLSAPAPREHIHTRQVECRGYLRTDGLWDIEGHMTDRKTYSFPSEERGEVTAGTPVHDMWIRMTVSDDLVIQAIEAVTDGAPYRICPSITPNFQRLPRPPPPPGFLPQAQDVPGGRLGRRPLLTRRG